MCPYPGTLLMILFALLPKSKQLSQSREWGGHKNHLEKGKDNYSLSNLKTQTIPVISCFSGSPERLRRYPSHLYISHILMTHHLVPQALSHHPERASLQLCAGTDLTISCVFPSCDYEATGGFRMEPKIN